VLVRDVVVDEPLGVPLGEAVGVGVGPPAVAVNDGVRESVRETLGVLGAVPPAVLLCEAVREPDGMPLGELLGVPLDDGVAPPAVPYPDTVCDPLRDGDPDGVRPDVTLRDGVGDPDGVSHVSHGETLPHARGDALLHVLRKHVDRHLRRPSDGRRARRPRPEHVLGRAGG